MRVGILGSGMVGQVIGALEALKMAGEGNISGKVLIDISNPLDFSKGMPPSLLVCNTDLLGEQIQRAFPGVRVARLPGIRVRSLRRTV